MLQYMSVRRYNCMNGVTLSYFFDIISIINSGSPSSPRSDFSRTFVLGEQLGKGTQSTVFKATPVGRWAEEYGYSSSSSSLSLSSSTEKKCYAVKRTMRKGLSRRDEKRLLMEARGQFFFNRLLCISLSRVKLLMELVENTHTYTKYGAFAVLHLLFVVSPKTHTHVKTPGTKN